MINLTYILTGNKKKAETMKGLADNLLYKLLDSMKFAGLKQDKSSMVLDDGTVIGCSSVFGMHKVIIYSPTIPVSKEVSEKIEKLIGMYFSAELDDNKFNLRDEIVGELLRACCYGETNVSDYALRVDDSVKFTSAGISGDCTYIFELAGVGSLSEPDEYGLVTYTATEDGTATVKLTTTNNNTGVIKVCALHNIVVTSCNCGTSSIGYTTTQMTAGGQQTLQVLDSVEGCTYTWKIDSGGGSFSATEEVTETTGTSVTYYAPTSNPGCTSNPTIQLIVDETVCDTLSMAVNDPASGSGYAYTTCRHDECTVPGPPTCYRGQIYTAVYGDTYLCDGTYHHTNTPGAVCSWLTCDEVVQNYCNAYNYQNPDGSPYDLRSADMIATGCCPAALL